MRNKAFCDTINKLIPSGFIAASFEYNSPKREFRDIITLYFDGKALFTRYCYGEAAGCVCHLWSNDVNDEGEFLWDYDACPYSRKTDAPKKITSTQNGDTFFCDEKQWPWKNSQILKYDVKNGYGIFNIMIKKLKEFQKK